MPTQLGIREEEVQNVFVLASYAKAKVGAGGHCRRGL
jgi:hypothetical protein